MNARYEDLIDEGLDAITSGRADLGAFLAAHPVEADELRPVLEAAVAVDRAMDVEPRPAFRYAARADFADRIQARSRRSWFSGWSLALRPLAVGLFAIVVATSLGFGTVAASEDSTPGQPLYGVKLAQESFRLALARDEIDRAGLQARFADRRVEELGRVGRDPSAEQRSYLARQVAANLQSVAQTVEREHQQGSVRPETRAKLARLAAQLQSSRMSDPELVRRVLAQTPAEHRPTIMRLLRLAQEEYQRTLQSLPAEAGDPTETTPNTRPVPGQSVPDVRPTAGQLVLDPRPTPGQRQPVERPTPERKAPGAGPAPGERATDARPTPGQRASPGPELGQPVPDALPAANPTTLPGAGPAPNQAPPDGQPAVDQIATDARPAGSQVVGDAQSPPDQLATDARAAPVEPVTAQPTPEATEPRPALEPTTPQPRATPSPAPRDTLLARPTTVQTTPTVRPTPERLSPALATTLAPRP